MADLATANLVWVAVSDARASENVKVFGANVVVTSASVTEMPTVATPERPLPPMLNAYQPAMALGPVTEATWAVPAGVAAALGTVAAVSPTGLDLSRDGRGGDGGVAFTFLTRTQSLAAGLVPLGAAAVTAAAAQAAPGATNLTVEFASETARPLVAVKVIVNVPSSVAMPVAVLIS